MGEAPFHRLRELAEAEAEAARRVFGPVIAAAEVELARSWGEPVPSTWGAAGPPAGWPAFERQYRTHRKGGHEDARWGSARFEWAFGVSELRRERPGEAAFAAGAAAPLDDAGSPLDDLHWLEERRAEGFEALRDQRLGLLRVVRWLYPGELVAVEDANEQGRELAAWVVGAFEHLAECPPP